MSVPKLELHGISLFEGVVFVYQSNHQGLLHLSLMRHMEFHLIQFAVILHLIHIANKVL